jgi:hypothetical protein
MAGFDWAITNIKAGHKVTRENWQTRAHIVLCDGDSDVTDDPKVLNIVSNEPPKEGEEPDIDIWLPDTEDLLAEDWSVIP